MIADTETVARPRLLSAAHLADLRSSGLNDRTIAESGIYTESDPAAVARILNWKRPATNLGPCMVIPFVDPRSGKFNGFSRVKPGNPRTGVKYEQPRGTPIRAYFGRHDLEALPDPDLRMVGFVEGEKKKLAASQAGLLTIGLTGVWAWQTPRKKGPNGKPIDSRELIDDLLAIVWAGRPVWIAFDFDPRRNPSVHQAAAEFARVLHDHGATVTILELPAGERDQQGLPRKMALDDLLIAHGEAVLRQWVTERVELKRRSRSLSGYRDELSRTRVESIGHPGVYVDRSATGAGKTHADMTLSPPRRKV